MSSHSLIRYEFTFVRHVQKWSFLSWSYCLWVLAGLMSRLDLLFGGELAQLFLGIDESTHSRR